MCFPSLEMRKFDCPSQIRENLVRENSLAHTVSIDVGALELS